MSLLNKIQQELKAPKNQFNSFGKYNYRSCEDILEAVKPYLKHGYLILTDRIVDIGKYNYVEATAKLVELDDQNEDEKYEWVVSAYAREEEDKKGMDASQMTGTASSYARKYALNGLFCIDDTKDADTMDNSSQGKIEAHRPMSNKVCDKCGADMIFYEPTGKYYCSKYCWRKDKNK